MRLKLSLPTTTFCGIKFGHSWWVRHLGGCTLCKNAWKNYKAVEKEKFEKSWNKLCKCGCGNKAAVGYDFALGHSIHTEERCKRRSEFMKLHPPMASEEARRKNSEAQKGKPRFYARGENNAAKRPEIRKKISENNPMHNPIYRARQKAACNTLEMRKKRSDTIKKNTKIYSKEVIEKRIEKYAQKLANGEYQIKNNWKTGWYVRKDGNKEWYDSSYEQKMMEIFDLQNVKWTKKHKIRIPYTNEKGIKTFYVPDFLVERDGKFSVEEVKGWMQESVKTKAYVAIEWCKQKGFSYRLFMGEKFELNKELSWENN